MEPRPFSLTICGTGADDDAVDLRLCRTVRCTAFTQEAFADDVGHLGSELLLPREDLLYEKILPAGNGGLHFLFLVYRAEKAAEPAFHALI